MNVLLVRLDHAGDIVMTVPGAAGRLRAWRRDIEVDVLTTRTGEALLRDDVNIDRLLVFDPPWSVPLTGKRRVPRLAFAVMLAGFAARTGAGLWRRYDAIVYLSFSPWERLLTFHAGRRRIGFVGPYRRRLHRWSAGLLTEGVPFDTRRHARENSDALVNRLAGVAAQPHAARLRIEGADADRGRERLRNLVRPGTSSVVIHPGGVESFKSWPHERFVRLGERLADTGRATPIFAMSPGEFESASRGFGQSRQEAVRYAVTHDLREFAALAAAADLVIANDGGPAHVAAAVGVPLVVVFGPTDDRLYRPVGPRVTIVRGRHPSAPCSTPWARRVPCCEAKACLREVRVDQVLEAAVGMLDASTVAGCARGRTAAR